MRMFLSASYKKCWRLPRSAIKTEKGLKSPQISSYLTIKSPRSDQIYLTIFLMITVKHLTWGKFLDLLKIKLVTGYFWGTQHTGKDNEFYPLMVVTLSPHTHPSHKTFQVSQAQKETEPAWKLWHQITYSTCRTKPTVLCIPLSPLRSLSSFKWFPGNCNNMDSISACLLLCSIWFPLAWSQRGCFWWISNISGVQRACLCISDIVTN